jgi:pyruvate/2-oxoglutarate dehydrogenase complex dihydrolipoamide dehydrogenase (E3) component
MRYTADRDDGRLLGVQLVGHLNTEIAKRIDIPATAIHNDMTVDAISDLDLSYTPPISTSIYLRMSIEVTIING